MDADNTKDQVSEIAEETQQSKAELLADAIFDLHSQHKGLNKGDLVELIEAHGMPQSEIIARLDHIDRTLELIDSPPYLKNADHMEPLKPGFFEGEAYGNASVHIVHDEADPTWPAAGSKSHTAAQKAYGTLWRCMKDVPPEVHAARKFLLEGLTPAEQKAAVEWASAIYGPVISAEILGLEDALKIRAKLDEMPVPTDNREVR